MKNNNLIVFLPRMDCGGAEKVMLQLMDEMVEKKINVKLFLIQKKGVLLSGIHGDIAVTELGSNKVPFYLSVVIAFVRLIQIVNKTKPKRMLSTITGMNLFVLLASVFFKHRPHIVVREAVTMENYGSKLKKFLVKVFYSKADSIVSVSHEVKYDLMGIINDGKKIRIINNPVQFKLLKIKAQETFNHPWIDDRNTRVICCMGRLCYQKGFDVLIDALAKFQQDDNVRLLILGEGEIKMKLQEQAIKLGVEQKIDFLGYQENPFKIIIRCHLFVLSSRWEGFVNSLLEVVTLGVPIVSTDCRGGPRQILVDGSYGKLVPVDDVDSLYHTMKLILKENVSNNIPPDYFEKYTIDNITRQYIDLYSW